MHSREREQGIQIAIVDQPEEVLDVKKLPAEVVAPPRSLRLIDRLPRCPLRWVPADNLARGDQSEMERAAMGSVRATSSCALSTLKSQGHETVKFGEVHWFGKKGERAVSESLVHRLHEQTP
jgi:hypothetical protein